MIERSTLERLYSVELLSSAQIAAKLECSVNQVNYWLSKHEIAKRSISDAVYARRHPEGDPFTILPIDSYEKAELYGMGLGLYWGEGTKANKYSIRLGNTDPELIKIFIQFLVKLYGVDKNHLRFGLQIFSDLNPEASLSFWMSELQVSRDQFYKLHITPTGSIGTYRNKNKHGVLTLYYHNKRLRDIIVNALPR